MPSLSNAVVKALAATAATTLVVAGIVCFFFKKRVDARRQTKSNVRPTFLREVIVSHEEFKNFRGNVKGLVVDENGGDVLYLRKLEGEQLMNSVPNVVCNPSLEEEKEKRMDFKLERPRKSEPLEAQTPKMVLGKQTKATPPAPPPPPAKKVPVPPPPPPRAVGRVSSLKPPPPPREKANSNGSRGTGAGQTKLKPLHWDKVTANADHSMVWDKIVGGSFNVDDGLMENLFGYANTNGEFRERRNVLSTSHKSNSASPAQIFILEPRKSQNIAIVLRSLAISRREILDALFEGHGLGADTLEKLTKMAPTQEEEAKILQFNGDRTKLADAESFLFHILNAVPAAFTRFNAMLFRTNYDPEVLHLKESLQAIELACRELRAEGLFLKLLEAILKAGNRMNAGTARGNAQGFNLSALRKLSDVKSRDGKTTLLHFVVEQVVRSEGRRCLINQNFSLDGLTADERDKKCLMLGLPALEALSMELPNVKKAATIEYDSIINICSTLSARISEIWQLMKHCGNDQRGGFIRETKEFLEECEEELKVVREEQARVMNIVQRTTQYYQAGASKDKGAYPLQLFVIVKDFLGMVDRVCLDISRKVQKKNIATPPEPSPPLSPSASTSQRFPNINSYFISDMSRTSSGEFDGDC